MGLSHQQARAILQAVRPGMDDGWYQVVQAISWGEGQYGNGWKSGDVTLTQPDGSTQTFQSEGVGSNNWGATQCNHGPPCGDACFPYPDRHASGQWYQGCFQKFGTPDDGGRKYIDTLTRIMNRHVGSTLTLGDGTQVTNLGEGALRPDDAGNVSAEDVAYTMKAGGYFELGTKQYADGICTHAQAIAAALGEPVYVVRESLLAQGLAPADPSTSEDGGGMGLLEWLLVAAGAFATYKAVT